VPITSTRRSDDRNCVRVQISPQAWRVIRSTKSALKEFLFAIDLSTQASPSTLRRWACRRRGVSDRPLKILPSLRANGSRECAPDDRLREAIQKAKVWIASSLRSLRKRLRLSQATTSFELALRQEAGHCVGEGVGLFDIGNMHSHAGEPGLRSLLRHAARRPGYGDPRAVVLPSGRPVWHQPDGSGVVLPFHPTAPDLGLQFLEDTPHNWTDTHAAWNGGHYDQWIPNKGPHHDGLPDPWRHPVPLRPRRRVHDLRRLPLLADGPDRSQSLSHVDGLGRQRRPRRRPVINNAEEGYDWSTYPRAAGAGRHLLEDLPGHRPGAGRRRCLGFTKRSLHRQLPRQRAPLLPPVPERPARQPLYDKARTGTNIAAGGTLFDVLRDDVRRNTLPQVSWIVSPEAFSEHGNWPANYGAWYISQVLDALTANPAVWSKTALFVTYDENDGFFDHMVPPTPPRSPAEGGSTVDASDEIFAGSPGNPSGPYGLGVRVPDDRRLPVEPGWLVCSEVFDHTSLIRFIERRFAPGRPGLIESNITAWRPRGVRRPHLPPSTSPPPDVTPGGAAGYGSLRAARQRAAPRLRPGAAHTAGGARPGARLRPARAVPYVLHGRRERARRPGDVPHRLRELPGRPARASTCGRATRRKGPGPTRWRPAGPLSSSWNVGRPRRAATTCRCTGPTGSCGASAGNASPGAKANLGRRRQL